MRGGPARLACLLGALMTLSLCGSAQGRERIVNGSPASQGEYPAQGELQRGGFICGGTLVSNRYFLTAGHCTAEDDGTELPYQQFSVKLGNVGQGDGQTFAFSALEVHDDYVQQNDVPDNDIALFTLDTPAPASLEPMRLLDASGENSFWAPGKQATVIGWGLTVPGNNSSDSEELLETTAPMRSDADCQTAYGIEFHQASMVCAGDGSTDTCQGDSGGPMMVSDGHFLVLAGITSWGFGCANPQFPGVYTRLGAPAFNSWVRQRVPMARATVSDATPDTGQAVTLSATATHPTIPGYFTSFAWDFDGNGTTDARGPTTSHTFPTGPNVARVTATGVGGAEADTAVAKVAVDVASPPPPPPPIATPAPIVVTTPRPSNVNVARILTLGNPKVRRGRFKMRINFSKDAPAGNAFVEVFRGKKKIGSVRARVRRGGSRQVSVKLTKAGRKLLRNSERKRLRVKVQVRVKRLVLGTKTLTIRL